MASIADRRRVLRVDSPAAACHRSGRRRVRFSRARAKGRSTAQGTIRRRHGRKVGPFVSVAERTRRTQNGHISRALRGYARSSPSGANSRICSHSLPSDTPRARPSRPRLTKEIPGKTSGLQARRSPAPAPPPPPSRARSRSGAAPPVGAWSRAGRRTRRSRRGSIPQS